MEDHKIECPYCNKKITEGIPFCPYCGKKQPQALNKDEIDKNPYQILQVSEDAEQEVIEAAYRSLARKYHPDSGGASVSEERMQEINWAHGILTDPDKLAEWKMKNGRKQATKSSTNVQSTPITKPNPVRQSQSVSNPTPPRSTGVISKKPSNTGSPLGWLLALVFIAFVVICAVLFGLITKTYYQTITPTPTRSPTNTHIPTINLLSRTPITKPPSNCILWSSLTYSDVGYYMCVYGRVDKIYSNIYFTQIIRFGNDENMFLLNGTNYYYSDVTADECIAAVGIIYQQNGSFFSIRFLYMKLEDIELYEYDGCP